MDKELLRVVIIASGILVMIGMLLWSFFRNTRKRRKIDFYDKGNPLDKIDDSLVVKTDNDEFDIVPLGTSVDDLEIDDLDDIFYGNASRDNEEESEEDEDLAPSEPVDPIDAINIDTDFENSSDLVESFSEDDFTFKPTTSQVDDDNEFAIPEESAVTNANDLVEELYSKEELLDNSAETTEPVESKPEYTSAIKIPEIIQIHILALDYEGFSGKELLKAFQIAKLEYGSMKIFEKLDENRIVKFSVASMVEPGTFPDTSAELKIFKCPGIVFFLQPGHLDDPIAAFDEYIKVIEIVASKLDGVTLGSNREPLTKDLISEFRQSLSV